VQVAGQQVPRHGVRYEMWVKRRCTTYAKVD
jgi:hypothetical protein